jgi:hypothetical protein
MNLVKPSGVPGRGEPVVDATAIRQAMLALHQQEQEFPLKVEGTHTLPYTARIQHVDLQKGWLHLKLIRPLPPELAVDAAFEMLFSAGDQRYEAPCIFKGREGYLLYRFSIPTLMAPSDRRQHKRQPFRPREKAYVTAQDAGVPGHVISGPLMNLGSGGLAFRVDRVMRFEDHMRVTAGLGFFDRGKVFPMIRVRDLPNLPVFDARGVVAHAQEGPGGIVVGIQFGELKESELRELNGVLDLRERMKRAGPVSTGDGAPRESAARASAPKAAAAESKGPGSRVSAAGTRTPDALRRLGRRCVRTVLAMAPGPERDQVHQALRAAGYLRLEVTDTLDQALAELRADPHAAFPLLVLEPPNGGFDPGGIAALRKDFGDTRELPVALLSREGTAPPSEDPLTRPLAWPTDGNDHWVASLDDLLGLDQGPA